MRHKVSTVRQIWGELREERKGHIMVIFSVVLRSHLMEDGGPEMMQEYRCMIIDYVLYANIFITHQYIL